MPFTGRYRHKMYVVCPSTDKNILEISEKVNRAARLHERMYSRHRKHIQLPVLDLKTSSSTDQNTTSRWIPYTLEPSNVTTFTENTFKIRPTESYTLPHFFVGGELDGNFYGFYTNSTLNISLICPDNYDDPHYLNYSGDATRLVDSDVELTLTFEHNTADKYIIFSEKTAHEQNHILRKKNTLDIQLK